MSQPATTTQPAQAALDVKPGEHDEDLTSTSGWMNVAKMVREIDVARVSDAKEDIDNLLVFAALFSAILTAFLIESYHALQPDTDSEMLFLLHRIATQNYTISAGFLNTSSPFPTRTPFEAPTWALRVNGLWFASLICSLAVASLGILVKAWLREYLSSHWMSPQEKLRSRQYRYPGLIQWKVFEIAAVLPLLLQLALGLFFVGLCLFTASVDGRMALTSIPLVSAWAFFFIATTVAPLFNPRCPFKVPGLRRVLQSARRHVLPRMIRSYEYLSQVSPTISFLKCNFQTARRRLSPHLARLLSYLSSLKERIPTPPGAMCHLSTPVALPPLLREEEEVVSGAHDETEVLLDIDKLIAQDSMLPLFISTFRQTKPTPPQGVQFVLHLLRHRLPSLSDVRSLQKPRLDSLVDLTGLSQRAYNNLMALSASMLQNSPPTTSSPWLHDVFLILLAKSPFPYPAHIPATMNGFITATGAPKAFEPLCNGLANRFCPSLKAGGIFPSVSTQLVSIFVCGARESGLSVDWTISFSLKLYNNALNAVGRLPVTSQKLLQTIRSVRGPEMNAPVTPILEDVWRYLFEVSEHLADRAGTIPNSGLAGLFVLMHLGYELGHLDEAARILRIWWRMKNRSLWAINLFAGTTVTASPAQEARFDIWPIIERMWSLTNETDYGPLLENSAAKAQQYSQNQYTGEAWDPLDFVAFTHAHLRIYVLFGRSHSLQWEKLWAQTQVALHKYWDDSAWTVDPPLNRRRYLFDGQYDGEVVLTRDRQMAGECLKIIDDMDNEDGDGDETSGEAGTTSIPDGLVIALGLFIEPDKASVSTRLTRIRALPSPDLGTSTVRA